MLGLAPQTSVAALILGEGGGGGSQWPRGRFQRDGPSRPPYALGSCVEDLAEYFCLAGS